MLRGGGTGGACGSGLGARGSGLGVRGSGSGVRDWWLVTGCWWETGSDGYEDIVLVASERGMGDL